MNKKEMIAELKAMIPDMDETEDMEGNKIKSIYLGSFMSLDPCGRYHHAISPNGITRKCEIYWERLEAAAEVAGGWIESGEGDPTDIFFCIGSDE